MSRGRYSVRYTDPSAGVPPVYQTGAMQTLAGPGAISTSTTLTLFESTGVNDALTLADGTVVGQIKTVVHNVDGGDGVLTPATFVDGTSIALTTLGESWSGMWTEAGWITIGLVDGSATASMPTIS